MIQVEIRGGEAKIILGMDPVGESLICGEFIDGQWQILEAEGLAIVMIENLV